MSIWLTLLIGYLVLGLMWLYVLVKNLERGSNHESMVIIAMVVFLPVTVLAIFVMIAWWSLSAAISLVAHRLRP